MFLFKTEGMDEYTYSKLESDSYDDYDHQIVLSFLKDNSSYDEIITDLYRAFSPDEVNEAIERITGINISDGERDE
jgi:hypothetical protein